MQISAIPGSGQVAQAPATQSVPPQRKPSSSDPDGDGDVEAAETAQQARQESGAGITFSSLA